MEVVVWVDGKCMCYENGIHGVMPLLLCFGYASCVCKTYNCPSCFRFTFDTDPKEPFPRAAVIIKSAIVERRSMFAFDIATGLL